MPIIESRFVVVKKATIRPNKVVFYDQFIKKNNSNNQDVKKISNEVKQECRDMGVAVRIQPQCNKHNFEISVKASSRIKEKVTWLYELAKIRR